MEKKNPLKQARLDFLLTENLISTVKQTQIETDILLLPLYLQWIILNMVNPY